MKFAEGLYHSKIRRFNELKRQGVTLGIQKELKPEKQPMQKPKEVLSERDWQELMGTNRDTYKRVNGAVRRR